MGRKRFGRDLIMPGWDSLAWALGLLIGFWLHTDFDTTPIDLPGLLRISGVAIAAQLVLGVGLHIYRGRYWVGSLDEVVTLARVTALVGLLLFALVLLLGQSWAPRTVVPTATLVALSIACAVRLLTRRHHEQQTRPSGTTTRRVIIFGAGTAGRQLVRVMLSDAASGYLPVALIDNGSNVRGMRISGVPVLGGREDIGEVARVTKADLLVFAMPEASTPVLREVSRTAIEAGLGMKVLPSLSELLRPWVGYSDLRDLDIIDLLGRRQIEIDITEIAGYLANRRILVTGAGGSIGSELCRQIYEFGPAELMMLDRDESALHAVQLSIYGSALLDSPDVILADIRDAQTVTEIFNTRRPDVVFHAAALKHLPMLEQYPAEAWKTNVLGTLHVLEAARDVGVEKFVNISTDKAANPSSVLGRSKRIGERLVADAAGSSAGTFLSVRFGNVLGSRGSVLTTFAEQLASGGPITITHPDVTRFFMTTPEAVQLVIQAAAIGSPGEALVLDMGAPVRIIDVARQLMEIAGSSASFVYTGLRDGEKLHEVLFGDGEEHDRRPRHPAISHVWVPPLQPRRVFETESAVGPSKALVELTREPAPETLDPLLPPTPPQPRSRSARGPSR
ncbi:MAG: polysaccharide biosynthesis protein [Pseudonocardiaceae bacterium]